MLLGSSAGGTIAKVDRFTPTPSQTVFALAAPPIDAAAVAVEVNGQTFRSGFAVNGSEVTWDTAIDLGPADAVAVSYQV